MVVKLVDLVMAQDLGSRRDTQSRIEGHGIPHIEHLLPSLPFSSRTQQTAHNFTTSTHAPPRRVSDPRH